MWPFNKTLKKNTPSVADQIAFAIKSLSLPEIQPRWTLNNPQMRTDWNTTKAIMEGYDASAIVYAMVEKRAKLISSVPWQAKQRQSDGSYEHMPESSLQKLIDEPNPDQSWLEVMYYLSQQVDLSGDGLLSEVRVNDRGEPIALWVLPSAGVKIKKGTTRLIDSYTFPQNQTVTAEDIVHIKLPNPSSQYFGQPVLMAGARATDIDREGANWQKSGLQNRGILDIMIKVPEGTTEEAITGVKKRWKERNAGPSNAREPIVTSGDVKNLGMNAQEMDFIESRKSVWTELAAAFGVPLAAVGFTEMVNLANAKEMNKMIWTDTIVPLLDLYKAQLTRQLASEFDGDWILDYDLSNVSALQDELDVKLANASTLINIGYTRNEVNKRLELGFDEDESGDIRYEPVGMIPVGADVDNDEEEDETDDEEKKLLAKLAYG